MLSLIGRRRQHQRSQGDDPDARTSHHGRQASQRRALRPGKHDKTHYTIRQGGEVVLARATAGDGDDPALTPFLGLLARVLAEHPERLQAFAAGFAQRIQALVGSVEVDLDAPLSADNE